MRVVEDVASYPRPPLIELVSGSVEIWIAGQQIALDQRYVRVCDLPPTHDLSAPFSVLSRHPPPLNWSTFVL